jgi:NAD(P)-dependent dehydrogenase (short-subunit alcohol dehydrogenase family)
MPKSIVITGATRGLGRALVDRFTEAGHTVAGCGRSKDAIAALTEELGAPHHFAVVDVADDAAVRAWAGDVIAAMGPPDLLINNAGLVNQCAPLWKVPADEFSRVVDVNVKGAANVLRHFLPAMIGRGSGVVVNFSSGWGRSTSPEVAPYCATKWAIEGLTGALAQELPAGLAAVALNPGIIDTEMLRTCFGSSAGNYVKPEAWSRQAAPMLLALGSGDNGDSVTVPM